MQAPRVAALAVAIGVSRRCREELQSGSCCFVGPLGPRMVGWGHDCDSFGSALLQQVLCKVEQELCLACAGRSGHQEVLGIRGVEGVDGSSLSLAKLHRLLASLLKVACWAECLHCSRLWAAGRVRFYVVAVPAGFEWCVAALACSVCCEVESDSFGVTEAAAFVAWWGSFRSPRVPSRRSRLWPGGNRIFIILTARGLMNIGTGGIEIPLDVRLLAGIDRSHPGCVVNARAPAP